MKGLIISSGYINNYSLLKKLVEEHDYIVCADGGVDHIISIKEIPSVVIGDLDSISEEGMKYIDRNNIKTIKHPVMKDKTDTELALVYLIKQGINDITLTGVTGSRMDHTMSNIFLLRNLNKNNIVAKIIDDNNVIYFANKSIKIKKKKDTNISIIPITSDGITVTLIGFLYPLNKKFIDYGSTLGISNEIVEDYGNVIIHKGEALVMESKD